MLGLCFSNSFQESLGCREQVNNMSLNFTNGPGFPGTVRVETDNGFYQKLTTDVTAGAALSGDPTTLEPTP